MYIAGHILSSIALAKITHKPLKVGFFPLAIAAMAVNLIDADHLIYYYLDTGIGNSFKLHPLHQLWAFVGLGVCLLAMVLKPYQDMILGILLALILHYGLDLLANVFTYDLKIIGGFEAICFASLGLLFRRDKQCLKYMIFFFGLWLFCNSVLGFEIFILNWQPHETRWIYLTSVILNITVIVVFWLLFCRRNSACSGATIDSNKISKNNS